MTYLEFVARLVDSLAWPCIVLVMFLVLRKPLRELVPLLHKLKYRELELEFSEQVREVREEADRILPAPPSEAPKSPYQALADRLSAGRSRTVVVNTWRQVVDAVYRLAGRKAVRIEGELVPSLPAVLTALEKKGVLTPEEASIIHQLGAIRNSVAHAASSDVGEEVVKDYLHTGARMVVHLDSM